MIAAILLSVFLVNACSAFPSTAIVSSTIQPHLIRNDYIYDNHGQFAQAYAVSDGTTQMKQGSLVPNESGDGLVMNMQGSFSFITSDGVPVSMSYTADKNGFQVKGYPLP